MRLCCVLLALLAPMAGGRALAAHTRHSHSSGATGFNVRRDDIEHFVDDVAQRDSLDRQELLALLKKAHREPKILEAMSAPAEAVVPWWEYRERFLTPERITRGVQFWDAHREVLERISASRGVAPEYLVAILGMETQYGRHTGKFRVLDALATLAFDYPPRADYFRDELEQFLLLAREDKINPLKATGSYAGAMGAPQFMPSAYRAYAVDEDGDHTRDLWNDWEDILGSVANFFRQHGWEAGAPVLAETQIDPGSTVTASGKVDLDDTVEGLAAKGVKLTLDVPAATPAVLVAAEQKDGAAYRVGFKNFYVITRYNRSVRYAMAVHDLAQAIAQEARRGTSAP
jgi:membrane-bound lytic murein transglycosylase B